MKNICPGRHNYNTERHYCEIWKFKITKHFGFINFRYKTHSSVWLEENLLDLATQRKTNYCICNSFPRFSFQKKIMLFIFIFFNSSFLSERESADRNFALAYYMKENKVSFSANHDFQRLKMQIKFV